jgi:hypothetical protein
MNPKNKIILVAAVAGAALLGAGITGCGKRSKSSSGDDFGTSLGNALVQGMAKDTYDKAKAKYDSGQDATDECLFGDTTELKKDKSDDAQQLAKKLDQLCEVDVPARKLNKDLDDKLAAVTTDRTDKAHADDLLSDQMMLKLTCDHADTQLKKIATLALSSQPNAQAMQSKHDAACTKDNLEGGPLKQAKRK